MLERINQDIQNIVKSKINYVEDKANFYVNQVQGLIMKRKLDNSINECLSQALSEEFKSTYSFSLPQTEKLIEQKIKNNPQDRELAYAYKFYKNYMQFTG